MTIYYANINVVGSGGDGSIGSPWQTASFLTQVDALTPADTIRVKGKYFYSGGILNIDTNLENWEAEPSRILAQDIFIVGGVVKNGIFSLTSGIHVLNGGSIRDYVISTPSFSIGAGIGASALGCHVATSGSFTGYPGTPGLLKDCYITAGSYVGMADIVTDRCAFTGSLPAGTHTNYQINAPFPNIPSYDSLRGDYASTRINAGIVYPPQPGNIPYTGYEVGLWDSPRNGIGAADFVAVWNDITYGSLSFNAVAAYGTKVMAVGYNGSIEMLSF